MRRILTITLFMLALGATPAFAECVVPKLEYNGYVYPEGFKASKGSHWHSVQASWTNSRVEYELYGGATSFLSTQIVSVWKANEEVMGATNPMNIWVKAPPVVGKVDVEVQLPYSSSGFGSSGPYKVKLGEAFSLECINDQLYPLVDGPVGIG